MYRTALHCFSCDGLRLHVKQSWNCPHSFHMNVWGLGENEKLLATQSFLSAWICVFRYGLWALPGMRGWSASKGTVCSTRAGAWGWHFWQHFRKFLLQNLCMFSFFAIAVSELKWAAGGGCCPMIVCGRWPALGASTETFNMHIWTSRWQTFGMFCQKARWFGIFPEAHAPSCFHWCPS